VYLINSKEQAYVEINKQISDLAFRFTKVMFEDDVKSFWECISAVDQSRAFGFYTALLKNEILNEEEYSFSEFIKVNFMDTFKKNYIKLKGDCGIANHLRISETGIPMVFMLPNVITPRHYIVESPENVLPLYLGVDTSMNNNNELIGEWKIRLYYDENYKKI